MKDLDCISGAEQLTDIFGYWPSFHDAEVLWFRFDRQSYSDGLYGPTLEAMVHTFEITSEVHADGHYILRHQVLVHLQFRELTNVRLDGFDHQNALMGLTFISLRDRQMERVLWAVRFAAAHGVEASFECYEVEVVSVIPCNKAGEPK